MKVIAFNGSPRKNWNTAILLGHALQGAAAQGAETEIIHLYDLNYKGCISCSSCRLKDGPSYGRCAVNDDLTPILAGIATVDAVIFGAPIYCGRVTGEMCSFLERLVYPLFDLEKFSSHLPKRIPTGFIYTMGANEAQIKEMGYDKHFALQEQFLTMVFGTAESLVVTDTCQYDDYSKYAVLATVDPEEKARWRGEQFPKECQKAFAMGARLARRG